MILRRIFYYWQFPAAIVLPIWLLVGWAAFGNSIWGFLGLLICGVALSVVMLAIAGITVARKSVRADRALSWWDVGFLALWQLSIVGFGFFGPFGGLFAIVGILLAIAGFWLEIGQLLAETGRRVRSSLDAFEQQQAQQQTDGAAPRSRGLDDDFRGPVIVVPEKDR